MTLLFFLACLLFSSTTWAQAAIYNNRPLLMIPLIVDGQELNGVWFYPPEKKFEALVDAPMLVEQLKSQFKHASLAEDFLRQHPERFLPLATFEEMKVKLIFDERDLLLRASLDPQSKNSRDVFIQSNSQITISPLAQPSFFSAYSNFYLGQSFSRFASAYDQDEEDQQSSLKRDPFYASADVGMGLGNYLFLSKVNYRESTTKPWLFGPTEMLRDFSEHATRLHLGEFDVEGVGFQQELMLGGAMFHRIHQHNPSLVSKSNDVRDIILKDESTVEIIINGSVVHKERYPAGPVSFSNFPFSGGLNNVQMRITDRSGKVETLQFSQFYDNELLAPGVWDYSFAYGSEREDDDNGRARYPHAWQQHSSFIRYGFDQRFTTGLNIQQTERAMLVGTEALFPISFGVVENHLAYAEAPAYRISFRNFDSSAGVSSVYNFRLLSEWMGEDYAYGADSKLFASAYLSRRIDLSSALSLLHNSAIGFGVGKRWFYQKTNAYDLRADLSSSLWREWNLSLNSLQRLSDQQESEFSVSLNLIWTPASDRHSVWASYDSQSQDANIRYRGRGRLSSSTAATTKYDAQVGRSNSGEYAQLESGITGPRGELASQYLWRKQADGYTSHYLNLESRFSLAIAGNRMALGHHVGDSFAIIDASPKTDHDVMVKQLSAGVPLSVTNFGPALAGDLSPYLYQEYSFDSSNLLDGESLTPEQFAVIPGYKRGYLMQSKLEQRIALIMIIVDQANRPITYLSGKLLDGTGKVVATFFSNRSGRIFVENLMPGTYRLQLDDQRFSDLSIVLENSAQGIIDYGTKTIEPREKDY